ncbi:MAG: uridylate kinase [Hyphomicrobium sp.]
MAARVPPLVVKVGGSLLESGRLAETLEVIALAGRPVVVVPGGGSFADKVRDLQRAAKFSDAIAHHMAMLGMHQMADVVTSMNEAFVLADSVESIFGALTIGSKPVWVPLPMMEGDSAVPANWATTSDTLAARLAELLDGAPLALLKSVDVAAVSTAADLAAAGVVDQAFPEIIERTGVSWRIFGPGDDVPFRSLLGVGYQLTGNC